MALEIPEHTSHEAPVAVRISGPEGRYAKDLIFRKMGDRLYAESRKAPLPNNMDQFQARFGSKEAAIHTGMKSTRQTATYHPFTNCFAANDIYGLHGKTILREMDHDELARTPMGAIVSTLAERTILIDGQFHSESAGPIVYLGWHSKTLHAAEMSPSPHMIANSWRLDERQEALEMGRRLRLQDRVGQVDQFDDLPPFDLHAIAIEALAFKFIHGNHQRGIHDVGDDFMDIYLRVRDVLAKAWKGKPKPDSKSVSWPHFSHTAEASCAQDLIPLLPRMHLLSRGAESRWGIQLAKKRADSLLSRTDDLSPIDDLEGFSL